jgi:hypothetical protein
LIVAPLQAVWYLLIHSVIAFVCAVEPEAFSEPLAHGIAAALGLVLVDAATELPLSPALEVLLSEPQADRARVPTRATPATVP